jgi:tetratricopeptide (TPR) repeat protein
MSTGGLAYDDDARDPDEARRQANWLSTDPSGTAGRAADPIDTKLERLLDQAQQKLERRDYHAALARLGEALGLRPRHAEAHRLKAECLLGLEHPERALEVLDLATRYATDERVRERIAATRSRCVRALADEQIERARTWLRSGRIRQAVTLLRACEKPLRDDQWFQEVRSYALLRLAREAPDTDPADARWLDPVELEHVLCWLTREELEEAAGAIRERRFTPALLALDTAWRIDGRGARAALLRATALLRRVQTAGDSANRPDLARSRAHLKEALRWVRVAEADPGLLHEQRPVAEAIRKNLRSVDDQLARQRAMEPVNALIERLNTIARIYNNKPVLYDVEVGTLRSSLAALATDVRNERPKHPSDSPAGIALADLARTIEGILAKFR